MRTSLLALTACLPLFASAQIYYYVDSINWSPQFPTNTDVITVTIHGHFTNTGAYIVYIEPNYVGSNIAFDMSAASQGGTAANIPYDVVIDIGPLANGVYDITVDGAYLVDLSPDEDLIVGGSVGIGTLAASSDVQVRMDGTQLCATSTDGSSVGTLTLIDQQGRIVAVERDATTTACMNISGLADGPYVLRMRDGTLAQRVMVLRR